MARLLNLGPVILALAMVAAPCSLALGDEPEQRAKPACDIGSLRWPGCPGYPCKPAKAVSEPGTRSDAIIVKFNADARVRLRDGALIDLGTGRIKDPAVEAVLAKYAALGCAWRKMHTEVAEAKLDQLRDTAMRTLGTMITDLNGEMFLSIPRGVDPLAAIDDFNALPIVEMAEQAPAPMPLPSAGDYRANQGYLKIGTEGIGAYAVRLLPGGTGSAVRIGDCEYSWNTAHLDVPAVTTLVANGSDPFSDNNHGTAVLGELGARHDGIGTEGGANGAAFFVAAANTSTGGYNPANAITAATAAFSAGDVIIIEQQTAGPNYTGSSQFGLVPSEWQQSTYNAIRVAIGNGICVVAAAGNGSQNLDDPVYSTGHNGFYPFLPANDSGDIIVGAASPPVNGSSADRSRLGFSCYGSTVDMQGYGESVYTTGYGDLYNASVNERYTATFSGTSSATPIVTGAVALFNSIYKSRFFTAPSPAVVRSQLRTFGAPQQSGTYPASQNIGPRPNVLAAWNGTLGTTQGSANNPCAGASGVSGQGTFIGSTSGATNDGAGSCGSSGASPDVWYRFTAPAYIGGTLVASTCGTHDYGFTDQGIDTVVSLIDGACGGTELACNDDAAGVLACTGVLGANRDSAASAAIVAGQTVYIRVTTFSTTTQGPFMLNVRFTPANDSCADAVDVSSGGTWAGQTLGAGNDGAASCGMSATNPDVWYSFTACDSGVLHVDTCGTHDTGGVDAGMDTVLSVFDSCGGSQLACNDDAPSASLSCGAADGGIARDSKIDLAMTAGQVVKIRVARFGVTPDKRFTLNVGFAALHDTCAAARAITPEAYTSFDTTCMTSDGYTEGLCAFYGNSDITNDTWFFLVAPSAGPMRIETCGSAFDTKLAVYDTFCPVGNNSPSIVACDDDSCGIQSRVNFRAVAGRTYGIRVGGYAGARGPGVLFVYCPADFNRDRAITVQDIFDFLSAWFAGDSAADTNGVGGINVQDIFDFLALWFGGC
jgi:hypothetical protein